MRIGVVFPQTELGNDPIAIRDYAQTAEELGYTHILAYDHVLGANPDRPGGWQGPYTYLTPFQEPFVLFGFMAGVTHQIGFTTGIIILPQRQTALVAKQAATLDVLSSGRLRVGIGIGWNEVEYKSLNENFHNRGKRLEEQVAVLRQLWTQPLVTFSGRWHTIPDAGINPLPIQRPIPIWFGGHAEAMLERAARLGDGWMPNYRTVNEAKGALDHLKRCLAETGRSPGTTAHPEAGFGPDFGLEFRLSYGDGDPAKWMPIIQEWQAAGATHFTLNTMGCGFDTPARHVEALRNFIKFRETI